MNSREYYTVQRVPFRRRFIHIFFFIQSQLLLFDVSFVKEPKQCEWNRFFFFEGERVRMCEKETEADSACVNKCVFVRVKRTEHIIMN